MSWKPKKSDLLGLLPAHVVRVRGPVDASTLYLSFDDGPHPEHTPALLDLLDRHGARASFFLVGEHVERYPAVVDRIVAGGHLLGNHSWSHPEFGKLDVDAQIEEIDRCDRVLAGFDGRPRHPFRPPRGELSLRLIRRCARRRQGIVYWSRDSLDYRTGLSPAELAAALQRNPPATGDIVLMHDDAACAATMLAELLPSWREAGFRFAALPALERAA